MKKTMENNEKNNAQSNLTRRMESDLCFISSAHLARPSHRPAMKTPADKQRRAALAQIRD
jgi:hypothetical protein